MALFYVTVAIQLCSDAATAKKLSGGRELLCNGIFYLALTAFHIFSLLDQLYEHSIKRC